MCSICTIFKQGLLDDYMTALSVHIGKPISAKNLHLISYPEFEREFIKRQDDNVAQDLKQLFN